MKSKTLLTVVGLTAFLTALFTSLAASSIFFTANPLLKNVIVAKVFFTSANIVLLAALTQNYFVIYKEMPSPFSRSLLIFSSALMFYAVTSSPILHVILGFESLGIGPFTYLPDMFVTAASSVLLYESYR